MAEWYDALKEDELKEMLPDHTRRVLGSVEATETGIEDLGRAMAAPSLNPAARMFTWPGENLWDSAKRELYLLICTDDEKYEDARGDLAKKVEAATAVIVTAVTAALAPWVGAAAPMLASIIVLLLVYLLRIGKKAWCTAYVPERV